MRLFLDLCTSSYLALEDGEGKPLLVEAHQPPLRNEEVLARLEALLQKAGQTWGDLQALAVGVGPGSFTGIRVGIALAQGLAFAKSLPIHPFNSLAALQAIYPDHACLIAAHGGRWYARWPAEDCDSLTSTEDLSLRFEREGHLPVAVTGELPKGWDAHPAFAVSRRLETQVPWRQLLAYAFAQKPAPLGIVRPHYVQASAAEAKRRQSESEPQLRAWRESDLPTLAELEAMCNPQPWSLAQWQSAFAGGATTQVRMLSLGNRTLGYCVLQVVAEEAELQLMGIHPDWRRKGLGSLLLRHAMNSAAEQKVRLMHLEVRQSNIAARQLYARLGWSESGRRKEYYANPREDAVLMAISLRDEGLGVDC